MDLVQHFATVRVQPVDSLCRLVGTPDRAVIPGDTVRAGARRRDGVQHLHRLRVEQVDAQGWLDTDPEFAVDPLHAVGS